MGRHTVSTLLLDRFKALLTRTRRTVEHEIKHGFANVPRGCSIQLEKQAQEYILENIKNSINNTRNIVYKLHDLLEINKELKVMELFENYHVSPQDVYAKKVTVTGLAAKSNLIEGYATDSERERLEKPHLDDCRWPIPESGLGFFEKYYPGLWRLREP